jgi:hypothetical protein
MKGTDWGKLVARATAVMFFMSGISYAFEFFKYLSRTSLDGWAVAHSLVFLVAGVVVWLAGAKFAPSEKSDDESHLAPAFVAAFAAFFFFSYSYSFVESIVFRLRTEPGALPPPLAPMLFDLFVVAGCVFIVVNAKSVVRWVTR